MRITLTAAIEALLVIQGEARLAAYRMQNTGSKTVYKTGHMAIFEQMGGYIGYAGGSHAKTSSPEKPIPGIYS